MLMAEMGANVEENTVVASEVITTLPVLGSTSLWSWGAERPTFWAKINDETEVLYGPTSNWSCQ